MFKARKQSSDASSPASRPVVESLEGRRLCDGSNGWYTGDTNVGSPSLGGPFAGLGYNTQTPLSTLTSVQSTLRQGYSVGSGYTPPTTISTHSGGGTTPSQSTTSPTATQLRLAGQLERLFAKNNIVLPADAISSQSVDFLRSAVVYLTKHNQLAAQTQRLADVLFPDNSVDVSKYDNAALAGLNANLKLEQAKRPLENRIKAVADRMQVSIPNLTLVSRDELKIYYQDLLKNGDTARLPNTSDIVGTVFLDRNLNGKLDDSEAGVSGVLVYVDVNNTGAFASSDPHVTTGSDGSFDFTNGRPGKYVVRIVPATQVVFTNPRTGGWSVTTPAQSDTVLNFGVYR